MPLTTLQFSSKGRGPVCSVSHEGFLRLDTIQSQNMQANAQGQGGGVRRTRHSPTPMFANRASSRYRMRDDEQHCQEASAPAHGKDESVPAEHRELAGLKQRPSGHTARVDVGIMHRPDSMMHIRVGHSHTHAQPRAPSVTVRRQTLMICFKKANLARLKNEPVPQPLNSCRVPRSMRGVSIYLPRVEG